MRKTEILPAGKRRIFDAEKAIPDACPYCGQNIDRLNACSISHHEIAPHLPYVKSHLHRKWPLVGSPTAGTVRYKVVELVRWRFMEFHETILYLKGLAGPPKGKRKRDDPMFREHAELIARAHDCMAKARRAMELAGSATGDNSRSDYLEEASQWLKLAIELRGLVSAVEDLATEPTLRSTPEPDPA